MTAPRPGETPQGAPGTGAAPGTTPGVTPDADAAAAAAMAASLSSLSGATGTPTAPQSATPNMVGDFFGAAQTATYFFDGDSIFEGSIANPGVTILDPTESVVGRLKQVESYSPLPVDRIFLDYVAYTNVPIGAGAGGQTATVNVQRFTPGFERTFLDGLASVEVRMPLARTLDSSINFNEGNPDADNWEFGNVTVGLKTLLYQNDRFAFTGGLGIRTPTASDLVFQGNPTTITVENNSVHLLPFFGALYFPNDTFFTQAVVQVDIDANGNNIFVNQNAGDGPQLGGVIQDQTFLYSSFLLGAWLYDNPASSSLSSIALTTEVHYSTAVSNTDTLNTTINGSAFVITEGGDVTAGGVGADNDFDSVTGVVGIHFFYAGGARVTFAYGVPMASDKFADGEFRTLLNRYY